jgi:hypothetical protein
MAVKAKFFWQSSTFWINLVGILVIALDFVIQSNLIPDGDVVTIILALVNILRRFQTPKVIQPLKVI